MSYEGLIAGELMQKRGGNVTLLHLPEIGVCGNTLPDVGPEQHQQWFAKEPDVATTALLQCAGIRLGAKLLMKYASLNRLRFRPRLSVISYFDDAEFLKSHPHHSAGYAEALGKAVNRPPAREVPPLLQHVKKPIPRNSEAQREVFGLAKHPAAGIAASILENYPDQLLQSHLLAQQRQDEALYRRSVRDAILQIVDNHPGKPEGRSFFASIPELVEGYLVSAVLSVRTDVLNSRHRLFSGEVSLHAYRKLQVSRSLIDSAIEELLIEAAEGLLMPDAGLGNRSRESEEIIRSAGRHLTRDTAFRVNRRDVGAFHRFYEACDKISSLKYEQAEGRGRLLLAPRDQAGIRTLISFKDSVFLGDHRRVRKLLELTSEGGALHTDANGVFGLIDGNVSTGPEDNVFEVVILGHYQWELRHAGELLMGVSFGQPYLPKLSGYESKLRQDLPRLFPGISGDATELLISLVRQAGRERHGTLMVISTEAASESERLKNQATPIEPCLLTPELLGHLTGIDGAVLVDASGHCHAIGVILDGQASAQGNPGRGARFNSAVRYVQSAMERGGTTLAIVVSEDGGVDLIPDPRPMIKRSLISAAVAEMEQISRAARMPRRRYNDLYEWLWQHRFYLLPDDCERLNTAVQEIERRFNKESPTSVWVVREKFEPDPGSSKDSDGMKQAPPAASLC